MAEETISVRIPSEKKAALDAIAAQTDRDVSLVIEEAVTAYLDLHAWQRAHIEEGVRQADAGEFASEAEVDRPMAALTIRWTRQAIADVDHIYEFIAKSNAAAARQRSTGSIGPSIT